MAPMTPHKAHIPASKLKRLQQKVELSDFSAHEISDVGWKYEILTYCSWRIHKTYLNLLLHYMTNSQSTTLKISTSTSYIRNLLSKTRFRYYSCLAGRAISVSK